MRLLGLDDDQNLIQSLPHILIIDDDDVFRELMIKVLRMAGYNVITAVCASDGYKKATDIVPDLIILNVIMAETNGFEICQGFLTEEKTKDIPIIFLTNTKNYQDKIRALSLGAIDYIEKPVNIKEFLARVNAQIRLRNLYKRNLAYEQALIESENSKNNSIFINGVAHNFNNLLTVAVGYLSLMDKSPSISQKDREYLSNIDKSLERIKKLIHQLLYLTQSNHSEVKHYEIYKILDESIFAARINWPNLRFTVHNKINPKTVLLCDKVQIIKALTHIIKNSYEIGGEDCELTVDAFESEDRQNHSLFSKTRHILIKITDSGPGFSDAALKYATNPFFSTKNTVGVGLGLSIVHKIVREYGGRMNLSNNPEKGGVVTLYFPICQDEKHINEEEKTEQEILGYFDTIKRKG
ncbi:hybrid sensor histidine kinase/response regulator [bacterium]|nr:hybrid sensor histidine kinase/response regulator [bacterium]